MEIIFFDIPINPPPIVVQNSLTNKFFQKKIRFLYIFNNKKIMTSLYRDIHPGDSWPYVNKQAAGQTLPDATPPVGKIHPFRKIPVFFFTNAAI